MLIEKLEKKYSIKKWQKNQVNQINLQNLWYKSWE